MSSPFPGSRWWKFDLHTHTPASVDTGAWQSAKGTPNEVTPETWLLKFMAAGVHAVAITDHNSGAWIDRLKTANEKMKAEDARGEPREGFQDLTLFPGVEISVQGGVHILAILDPSATTSDVDTLLGAVGYQGTKGDSDGVTTMGPAQVIQEILRQGGIPIPAHADQSKGLLELGGGKASRLDANTVIQAMEVEGLLALEWRDTTRLVPSCVVKQARRLTRVLGSDCHSFRDKSAPGLSFTWAKMASPSLEGLRLALLDGAGVSIRRSDEGDFNPYKVPPHMLEAVEIHNTRWLGNGRPVRIEFSPYFNAIVGGRGTGKSTVVHALRLAAGRGGELTEASEPKGHFDAFRKSAKGRAGDGAIKDNTEIRIEWAHDQSQLRIGWQAALAAPLVEELQDDTWRRSASQAVVPARFPIRILSQGQIAHIAGDGRRALLAIIDEAAGTARQRSELDESIRTFKAQRAKVREMDGRLADLPEVERKLNEVVKKLATFTTTDHASILRGYTRVSSQAREIKATLDQVVELAQQVEELSARLELDDWAMEEFAPEAADVLDWRASVDAEIAELRRRLLRESEDLRTKVNAWKQEDPRIQAWRERHKAAKGAYEALQQRLTASGVQEPDAFDRLTRERQTLEHKKKELVRLQSDRKALVGAMAEQQQLVAQRRSSITASREKFVSTVLHNNPHVRIAVVPFGFDPRQIERELRDLLDLDDERFANEILSTQGEEERGLARDLALAADKASALHQLRDRLGKVDPSFNGHFRNHLTRKHKEPEFADRLLIWSPEDDLRIEYQREGAWMSIDQGSQGQRSAALLAFLLAFGEEPIVLDQPEDDLDNHLIYDLIVRQIRENKLRRQLIIVTHNPNVVVNGDAELVHVMAYGKGQCFVQRSGALQEKYVRDEVCEVMEGGREAFARRWKRLGGEG